MERQFKDLVLTEGRYKGKKVQDTPVEYQKVLDNKRVKRDLLLWFDILKTPIQELVKDFIVFDSTTSYEDDLQIGTLRGFVVGDPIVEIFEGKVSLFKRTGWINLKERGIGFNVENGYIIKPKI